MCKSALEGDVKFMEKFLPGSTQYVGCWRKKCGFEGTLVEVQCKMLVERIAVSVAGKTGKAKQRKELQLLSCGWSRLRRGEKQEC